MAMSRRTSSRVGGAAGLVWVLAFSNEPMATTTEIIHVWRATREVVMSRMPDHTRRDDREPAAPAQAMPGTRVPVAPARTRLPDTRARASISVAPTRLAEPRLDLAPGHGAGRRGAERVQDQVVGQERHAALIEAEV